MIWTAIIGLRPAPYVTSRDVLHARTEPCGCPSFVYSNFTALATVPRLLSLVYPLCERTVPVLPMPSYAIRIALIVESIFVPNPPDGTLSTVGRPSKSREITCLVPFWSFV